jgi:hypothetical protein
MVEMSTQDGVIDIYVIENKPNYVGDFLTKLMNYYVGNDKKVNLHLIALYTKSSSEDMKNPVVNVEKIIGDYTKRYEKFLGNNGFYKFDIITVPYDAGNPYPIGDEGKIVKDIKDKIGINSNSDRNNKSFLIDMLLIEENTDTDNEKNDDIKRLSESKKILSHMLYEDTDLNGRCMIYTNYNEDNTAELWLAIKGQENPKKIFFRSDFESGPCNQELADKIYGLAAMRA